MGIDGSDAFPVKWSLFLVFPTESYGTPVAVSAPL